MGRLALIACFASACLGLARPASADLTAFMGSTQSPASHSARGAALGLSLAFIGLEFEYSDTSEKAARGAPALRSGMFNLLVQMPFAISRLQFYGTVGGGVYRERLAGDQDTGFGGNVGAGVKVSLIGPIRVRLDYRAFRLVSGAKNDSPQRVYVGFNLAF